jgi:glycine oxidase
MLAPQVEAHESDDWFRFLLKARDGYERLACELLDETGIDVEHRCTGVLRVALDEAERTELRERAAWQSAAGLNAEWLEPAEARELEPGLSPEIAGALWLQDQTQVQAPKVVRALAEAAARRGVEIQEGTPVMGIEGVADSSLPSLRSRAGSAQDDRARVAGGVLTRDGIIRAGAVVLAAGVWSPLLEPALPIGPVKGQIVCGLAGAGQAPRHIVWGPGAYVTPKVGGQILLGATEEASFDARPTLGASARLIAGGTRLLPGLGDLVFDRAWAGLRPATPDQRPVIGAWPGRERLFIASGHYRNGILLGPLTGHLLATLITGAKASDKLAPFSPARFLS